MGKWRGAAQRHEAALAEAAAQLHTREAQSLAATSLEQGQSDRLQGEAAGLRRRCAELAARLQEAQRAVAQLQVGGEQGRELQRRSCEERTQLGGSVELAAGGGQPRLATAWAVLRRAAGAFPLTLPS